LSRSQLALAVIAASRLVTNDYYFSAAYTVLQFVILATAWNILGGYAGYVNFGSAAFFAVGAYSSVFLYKAMNPPLIVMIVAGTLVAALLGLAGRLPHAAACAASSSRSPRSRSRSCSTPSVVNWDYVGGRRGAYILQPRDLPFGLKRYIHVLFCAMVLMAASPGGRADHRDLRHRTRGSRDPRRRGSPPMRGRADAAAEDPRRDGERRAHGHGRDDVPVLPLLRRAERRLQPLLAVNSIAMPLIGGMMSWPGAAALGAVLLGTVQQVVQVHCVFGWNLLIVGVLLVVFVTVAPNGIMGGSRRGKRRRKK
jgi:branched-chain amino acid transport system permease protein